MTQLSQAARILVRHIATSKRRPVPLAELTALSPADGDIVNAKNAARDNAAAITEIIQLDLAYLWVVDRYDEEDDGRWWGELTLNLTEAGARFASTLV